MPAAQWIGALLARRELVRWRRRRRAALGLSRYGYGPPSRSPPGACRAVGTQGIQSVQRTVRMRSLWNSNWRPLGPETVSEVNERASMHRAPHGNAAPWLLLFGDSGILQFHRVLCRAS